MEGVAEEGEKEEACGDDDEGDKKAVRRQDGKFEEIASERDEEDSRHDADNGEEEGGAEFVEGPRNPINQDQIDSEGDKN